MRLAKMCAAVVMVGSGVFSVAACGPSTCAGASTVVVERGGSGGGASFSGSRSGSYSGGSSRGSGSGASYSGSRSGSSYSGSRSGSSYSGSRTITLPSGQKATYSVPSRVGSSYTYYGHSFSYHPESYWLHLGAPDPYNPYDRRNFDNPFSPFYHYRLAVSGC